MGRATECKVMHIVAKKINKSKNPHHTNWVAAAAVEKEEMVKSSMKKLTALKGKFNRKGLEQE